MIVTLVMSRVGAASLLYVSRSWSLHAAKTDTEHRRCGSDPQHPAHASSTPIIKMHAFHIEKPSRAEPRYRYGTRFTVSHIGPTCHPGDAVPERHASPAAARRAPCAGKEEAEGPCRIRPSSSPLLSVRSLLHLHMSSAASSAR